jgi:hypothetical protein
MTTTTLFRVKDTTGCVVYASPDFVSLIFKEGNGYLYAGSRSGVKLAEGTMTEARLQAALERARQYEPLVIDFTNPAYLAADAHVFHYSGPQPTVQEPGQIAVFEAPTAINTSGSVAFTVKAPS